MRHSPFLTRAALLCAVSCAALSARAQILTAPIEAAGFSRLTSHDTLAAFVRALNGRAGMEVREIATSFQGRPVFAVSVTRPAAADDGAARPRVLLFAQQHGDEPTGKEALLVLLARCARGELQAVLDRCDLLVVPQMNPDGSEAGRRRTADSIDLNRNHVLLSSPEPRALHNLYGRHLPHVTLDVHQYGAYGSSWTDRGFIKTADVQLGMLTNLNTGADIRAMQHGRVAPFMADRMTRAGYSFHEYIVGSPAERIRHSTTEINDGRQSFGVLGSLSFIQEGIRWKTPEEGLERCVRSQLESVEALLAFCAENANLVVRTVEEERRRLAGGAGNGIVLRMDHRPGRDSLVIPVRHLAGMQDTTWLVTPYHGTVVPLVSTVLPAAYYLPSPADEVLAVLRMHGVEMRVLREERTLEVEEAVLLSIGSEVIEEDTVPLPMLTWRVRQITARPGEVIVPLDQLRGVLAGILLEPSSMWGLAKYPRFGLVRVGERYPVLRVLAQGAE